MLNNENEDKMILTCCIFIHAAKMDQNFSQNEKKIIIKALNNLFNKDEAFCNTILIKAEKKEEDSNQILYFTKKIKSFDKAFRLKVIKVLWEIIYSDNVSDMYESNLMRRLSGLLYISDKESGEIKKEILKYK